MPTVLIIDDDVAVLELLRAVLAGPQLTLLTATSAAAGLEHFSRELPDVVLLDIELGDLGGLETFRRLRQVEPRTPVIFVTGSGTTSTAIEAMVLDAVLSEIDVAGGSLLAQTGKVGQHLRDNDWLMAIKQRTGIPGGACEFDLPAYHHWLNLKPTARQRDLQGWLEPLLPIHSGLSIILRLLRDNGKTSRHTAYHGLFQLMLTTAKVAQLLRLSLAQDTPCVPEISANKYALNIRFVGIAGMDRGSVFDGDVEFDLMFCNL